MPWNPLTEMVKLRCICNLELGWYDYINRGTTIAIMQAFNIPRFIKTPI
jgi:hypothetical protein